MHDQWWRSRAWQIVGALSVTEMASWGILYYAFSVFLVPMHDDLGWSVATLTGAYSVALLVSGLCAPSIGRWLDRHGPRALMTGGSLLGMLAMFGWSRAESVWTYYVAWIAIGAAMAATLYDPAFTTITQWFDAHRSRALLTVTVAGGFASTIFVPLSGFLLERMEWREVITILAIIFGVVTIPLHALVLRARPDGPQTSSATLPRRSLIVSAKELFQQPTFAWLTTSFVLQYFSTAATSIALIPYLTERGDDPSFAALATGFIGAAQVLARLLATALGRHVSPVMFTAFVFGLQSVALVVLLTWQTHIGVFVSVLLLGMGRGVVTLMRPQLVGDFYGRARFGEVYGVFSLSLTIASAIAPTGLGLGYTLIGSYTPIVIAMATLSALAVLATLRLARCRRLDAVAVVA